MSKLFTTGPVENAVSMPALSVLVKVLNNNPQDSLKAKIILYSLNVLKEQVSSTELTVLPLNSDFSAFQIDDIKEYEIQIEVDRDEAMVSVWGLDAEANLIAAQRFVHSELKEYQLSGMTKIKRKVKLSRRRKSPRPR